MVYQLVLRLDEVEGELLEIVLSTWHLLCGTKPVLVPTVLEGGHNQPEVQASALCANQIKRGAEEFIKGGHGRWHLPAPVVVSHSPGHVNVGAGLKLKGGFTALLQHLGSERACTKQLGE
jgi:hypothetical protein